MLQNIETYLVEEEVRMIAQDKKWKEYQVKENLKEMGDVSSGMASTVIQIYLSSVLDSFIHPSVKVRTKGNGSVRKPRQQSGLFLVMKSQSFALVF